MMLAVCGIGHVGFLEVEKMRILVRPA